ncbi:hypothetical protein AYI68_g3218 [Smittium mucronatum]|uniref:Uncharacterized protein n=1 Tax=Smittium mucronatum TaxID=133383 RepID=A0A1R0H0K5_9FUNG|nr:hypothetical protein AYI68_g3218 [Smittium mucronatum]
MERQRLERLEFEAEQKRLALERAKPPAHPTLGTRGRGRGRGGTVRGRGLVLVPVRGADQAIYTSGKGPGER